MPAPPGENRCESCGEPRNDPTQPCAQCGLAAPSIVTHDLACRRCGYSLRGLSLGTVCPECAAPVRLSLLGDFLAASDPSHVARLLRGALLVEIALYLGVLLSCIASPLALIVTAPSRPGLGTALVGAVHLALGAAGLIGWWLLSTRDPGGQSSARGEGARRTLRVCLAVSAGSTLLGAGGAASSLLIPDPFLRSQLVRGGVLIGSVTGIVQYFASVAYVRVLAARIPSADLGSTARTAMVMPLWIFGLGSPVLLLSWFTSGFRTPLALLAILTIAGMAIACLVWFLWYCSMVSGLRDRLETVRATMPQVLSD